MPFRDGTGPSGRGPRTGHGAGNCASQGGAGRFVGRGFGLGGRGRGFGRGFGIAPEQERSWLENQAQALQAALQSITERLDALKKE
jgi:Family of unknown function (DUF5320)